MQIRPRGFSLLELMTAITVLAVVLGMGVPAFASIMRNNQIAAQSNNLLQALTLARSEALTRGKRVSVCAAGADENSCGAAWQSGWVVFEDDFGSAGSIDASDVVLQRWSATTSGVEITGVDDDGSAASSVTYMRNGRAEFVVDFTVDKDGCDGEQERQINVNLSGRVALTRVMCTED
jgi:type IV fimbrial biogenesis protein FimT